MRRALLPESPIELNKSSTSLKVEKASPLSLHDSLSDECLIGLTRGWAAGAMWHSVALRPPAQADVIRRYFIDQYDSSSTILLSGETVKVSVTL